MGAKKKGHKMFGVPLVELIQQAPQGYKVPFIVKKICTYIEHHGKSDMKLSHYYGLQITDYRLFT